MSFNMLIYQEISLFCVIFCVTGIFSQNGLSPKIILGVFATFSHFFGFVGGLGRYMV